MGLVKGFADQFNGLYITGWAIAEPDTDNCRITVIDEAGLVAGAGRASLPRQDLGALGYGRNNFAYRIAVASFAAPTQLRVLADDVELNGSPVIAGPGLYDGAITVAGGVIEGWVTERVTGFSPPLVAIDDAEGRQVAEVQTVAPPAGHDPFYAPARFRLPLPDACFGPAEGRLTARVGDFVFAESFYAARLEGFLDVLLADRCAGWLLSPDAPKRRLEIEVWRDELLVGRGVSGNFRGDLAAVSAVQDVGFDIVLKPDTGMLTMSAVSVRLAGATAALFGGPFMAGRRPALLAAGKRAGAAAIRGGDAAEAAVAQAALGKFIAERRNGPDYVHLPVSATAAAAHWRLTILIPVYRGVQATRACIESVLAWRQTQTDRLVLINDAGPEPEMAGMLKGFAAHPHVVVLTNQQNLGFIRTVNRGLAFCRTGDVLLLNADTVIFAGGIDELWRAAHSSTEIGTATALSNNATIFSYPHPTLATERLADAGWDELAAVALQESAGRVVEVPTAHGFCMVIRRAVLDRVGAFNEVFGRGYGEENEFCLRAADLGYLHVAACGVLVEHRESVSFGAEKEALKASNLRRLEGMYPEYTATVMAYESQDGLRVARWSLDAHRLRRAVAAGQRFALILVNGFIGGTKKAVTDIAATIGYAGAAPAVLSSRADGVIEFNIEALRLRAVFMASEMDELFDVLTAAAIGYVELHQVLGYDERFIERLIPFMQSRRSVVYLHDYYAMCPRVTLINAVDEYCHLPGPEVCARCVKIGGAHEGSKLQRLSPAAHRALFGRLLQAAGRVVAPSGDTARRYGLAFAGVDVEAVAHPHVDGAFPERLRAGAVHNIVLLGAVGPHKGSRRLLAMAERARFTHPDFRFHVIGYTDIDDQLAALDNVTVSGPYTAATLPALLDAADARVALFLHGWPETFSYTLTEAVRHGLLPVVPDIGAPADRVRAAGFGLVLPFPIDVSAWLKLLAGIDWAGLNSRPDAFNLDAPAHDSRISDHAII